MEIENLYFNQNVQVPIKNIEKAKKAEEDGWKQILEETRKKTAAEKNEDRNHPIFKEMREIAKSPKLKEALRAYYDAKIKGRKKRNQYIEEIPFEMHIHDSYVDGHEKKNEPFGRINIIVEYWRYTEYGYNKDYGKEKRDNISFEIAYDEKNGLTFNGKDSFDEAIKVLAELTALKIMDNKKWEKEKEEERINTRPVRLELCKQNFLKRKEKNGFFRKIGKTLGLDHKNQFTEQELEYLANFK